VLERTGVAARECSEQRRALPEVVVLGLGDRRSEALAQLRLQ
jgi:hypothetical protein